MVQPFAIFIFLGDFMAIKIYNSLTKTKQEFIPLNKGVVLMYVCGPTVYGPSHVGHARTYVNFDTVRRYFEFSGFKVKYVQNITDVGHLVGDGDDGEDKLAKQARLENADPYAIAYKYENMYFNSMDKLNVSRFHRRKPPEWAFCPDRRRHRGQRPCPFA